MDQPVPTVAGRLARLLRTGVIAGVVVAAIAMPFAALGGFGLKAGTELLAELPTEITVPTPAQTSYVYANDGETLLTMFYEEHRRYTRITEMSPYIQHAIVASEDGRFYEHNGVDPKGIARAFVANSQAGAVEQGASTLTMQFVRMALRDGARTPAEVHAATEQTARRKLREARLAIEVEKRLTKAQILERYLNQAYFGHRAYGIFAAAEIFFSKRPKDLDLSESAMLAGLVQAPSGYDPATQDQQAATARRNWVIDRMVALGYVAPGLAAEVKAEPIELRLTDPPNDCTAVPKKRNHWGFFCDLFRSWWLRQPAFGDTPYERESRLRRGGYTIITSLDPEIQQFAQRHVVAKEPIGSPFAHGTVVIQPRTGRVKAMAVNRTYSLDQDGNGPHTDPRQRGHAPSNYPNTVNPLLGGGDLPGYQAGSTFKIFTMVAALDAGRKLSTSYHSPRKLTSIYHTAWNDPKSCGGRWCPENASRAMTGRQTMWSGFGKSVNTYFVQLEQSIGAARAVRMAENMGLRWRSETDRIMAEPRRANGWGAFTLGVADTTPLEMANAYATLAAEGVYCAPLPVESILTRNGTEVTHAGDDGTEVAVAEPQCRRAVSEAVARAATDAARCVTGYGAALGGCGGWSTAPQVYGIVGRPVAGKTGTTDDNRAAWFVGYTPQLAAASVFADPDNPFHPAGEWNSWKPIQAVAETLRDGHGRRPVAYFTPPPLSMLR